MITTAIFTVLGKLVASYNLILSTAMVTAAEMTLVQGNFNRGSGDNIAAQIYSFYEFTKPILNALVGLLCLWGAYKVVAKLVQGEDGAAKIAIIVLGGIVVWFFIVPEIMIAIMGNNISR